MTCACLARRLQTAGSIDDRGVCFSPPNSRKYRYLLWRGWDPTLPRMAAVLLNPSIADADRDDPTLRRVVSYAMAWNYGAVDIVNVFAGVATKPKDLRDMDDPVGPLNDMHVQGICNAAKFVLCGWGEELEHYPDDASRILRTLRPYFVKCHALALTKNGSPKHPLYQRADLKPERLFEVA